MPDAFDVSGMGFVSRLNKLEAADYDAETGVPASLSISSL